MEGFSLSFPSLIVVFSSAAANTLTLFTQRDQATKDVSPRSTGAKGPVPGRGWADELKEPTGSVRSSFSGGGARESFIHLKHCSNLVLKKMERQR